MVHMEFVMSGISKDGESFKTEYTAHSGYFGVCSGMGYQTTGSDAQFIEYIRKAQDNGVTNIVIEIKDL